MQAKAERTALKDLLNKLLRNYVYFSLSNFDSIHAIIHGDKGKIYGERFAEEWVKNKYGARLRHAIMEPLSSKYLNIYALITGIAGLEERLAVEAQRRVVSSELESLLRDIKPLY
jgi:hypothetical protein